MPDTVCHRHATLAGTVAERKNPLDEPAGRCESRAMSAHEHTRAAWEDASQKHVREYVEHLEMARTWRLLPVEESVLGPLLPGAEVLHPQSGHGLDDHALLRLGAASVHGLDYSPTAVEAAQRRADELGVPCRYQLAELPRTGLADGTVDLVYTGKGALIWLEDLHGWAQEMRRLLRPGGHLFVLEAHPLVPLWAWDADEARVREDRSYFAASHLNDTFPSRGATEHQRTLAEIVMTVQGAGFELLHLAEHPEPFWQPEGEDPAAWDGRLPNTISLLARRS